MYWSYYLLPINLRARTRSGCANCERESEKLSTLSRPLGTLRLSIPYIIYLYLIIYDSECWVRQKKRECSINVVEMRVLKRVTGRVFETYKLVE